MKRINKTTIERTVTLEGLMTFDKLENGLRTADFECCEDIEMEAFCTQCKVQVMRDGNVYMTEQPKRIRNKAIFRDDNCSLSHGQNGRYYFVFSLNEDQLAQLPYKLVTQAGAIAHKVLKKLILNQ